MSIGVGFIQNVRPATQTEVVEAFLARIRAGVPGLGSETNCFLSQTPEPSVEVQDNTFATVVVGGGQFNQGMMDGSGNIGVNEIATVTVNVFSRIMKDRLEHSTYAMLDSSRGQLALKRALLRTLAGKNLDGGTYQGAPSVLLLESMFPRHADHRTFSMPDEDFASFSVVFELSFCWDLGEAPTFL